MQSMFPDHSNKLSLRGRPLLSASLIIVGFVLLTTLVILFNTSSAWPQDLTILSPEDGQVFHPGESIILRVATPEGFQMQSLHVIGLGIHNDLDPPFEIAIPIKGETIGPVDLFINAQGSEGFGFWDVRKVFIKPLPNVSLVNLQVDPQKISLSKPGTRNIFFIKGEFSDGVVRDITFSEDTTITSLNKKVVVIEDLSQGKYIKAVGPGKTCTHRS